MTNAFYPNDYKFGIQEEKEHLETLRKFFKNDDIKRSESDFAKHDFYNDEYTFEMKSRKHFFDKHYETMITFDKIVEEKDKKLILLFNFLDGLYYIEYDKDKFNNYRKELFSREQAEWNEKIHLYIPITDLDLIKPKCLLKCKSN
jgi:hypothetical protein